ncbi:MAG: S8 family peptidase [Elusimicrobia bacterium]|nr:S8 family peptidase [Elusimicrobiota bacterium]
MKTIRLIVALVCGIAYPVVAQYPVKFSLEESIAKDPNLGRVPNQRIILFKDHSQGPTEREALVRKAGGETLRHLPSINALVAYFPDGIRAPLDAEPSIHEIVNDDYAELHFIGALAGCAGGESGSEVTNPCPANPGDVSDKEQPWGIQRVRASKAWEKTRGEGAKVCIIDTGIDLTHPDVAPNVRAGKDLSGSTTTTSDITDYVGHGTHVAGTIAAIDDDSGVVGVAPKANLYISKVFGKSGSTSLSAVIAGIEYCTEIEADVINMSLGSSRDNTAMHEAVKAAFHAGAAIIVSAGNSGGSVGFPGAYEEVLGIAASDDSDKIASFSSHGQEVDLIAPGVKVLSTVPTSKGSYAQYNGTSMAAPHVTGLAALVRSAFPNFNNTQVYTLLKETAAKIGLKNEEQGSGLPQACSALGFESAHQSSPHPARSGKPAPRPNPIYPKLSLPVVPAPMNSLQLRQIFGN